MEPDSLKEESRMDGKDTFTKSDTLDRGQSISELRDLFHAMEGMDSAQRAEAMAEAVTAVAEGKVLSAEEQEIPRRVVKKSKAQKKKEKKELEKKRLAEQKTAQRIVNLRLEQRMAEHHWKAIKEWNIQEIKKKHITTVRGQFVLVRSYYNRIFENKAHIINMLKKELQDERFITMLHTTSSVFNDVLIDWMENYLKTMRRNFIMTAYELKKNITDIHINYFENHEDKLRYLTTKYIEEDFAEFELKMAAQTYASRETEEDELKQELYEKTYFMIRSKEELSRKLIKEVIPFVHTVQMKKEDIDISIEQDKKNSHDLEKRTHETKRLCYLKEELKKRLKTRLEDQEEFNKRAHVKREYLDSIQNILQERLRDEITMDRDHISHLVKSSNNTIEWLKERLEKAKKILTMITLIRKYETYEEQQFNYKMTLRKHETYEEQRLNYGDHMKLSDIVDCDYRCNYGCVEDAGMSKFWKRVARAFDLSRLLNCERNKLVQERDCFCRLTRKLIMEMPKDKWNCKDIQLIPIDYKNCERLILNDIKSRNHGHRMIIL